MARKFESRGGGREVLRADGFWVSYVPTPGDISMMLGAICNIITGEDTGRTDDQAETALARNENGQNVYRILVGDFRAEYEGLLAYHGWDACLRFFEEQRIDHESPWSTTYTELRGVIDVS